MASRRIMTAAGEASFDHGAQYFTARDPAFRSEAEAWARAGWAARWPAAGPDAWVGLPAMNGPLRGLAAGLHVRWQCRVASLGREDNGWRLLGQGLEDETPFDGAIVAVPAEQAAPLLSPWDGAGAATARATLSQPCWTVMAAFATPVPAEGDIVREAGPIGWAARNSAKPGRTGPDAWVIQAGPEWSAAHLEQAADDVVAPLLREFAARSGPLPGLLAATAHRWRFARSGSAGKGSLWDTGLRLGACGDWLLGPRVECAWLSGAALAERVIASEAIP